MAAVLQAIKQGLWNVLQEFIRIGEEWHPESSHYLAKERNFHVLRWAIENGCPWHQQSIHTFIENRDYDMFKFALMNGHPWDIHILDSLTDLDLGMTSNNPSEEQLLSIIQWTVSYCRNVLSIPDNDIWGFHDFEEDFAGHDTNLMYNVISQGLFNIMKWIVLEGCPWSPYSYMHLVDMMNVNILQWSYDHGCNMDRAYIAFLDVACKACNYEFSLEDKDETLDKLIDVVEWCFNHGTVWHKDTVLDILAGTMPCRYNAWHEIFKWLAHQEYPIHYMQKDLNHLQVNPYSLLGTRSNRDSMKMRVTLSDITSNDLKKITMFHDIDYFENITDDQLLNKEIRFFLTLYMYHVNEKKHSLNTAMQYETKGLYHEAYLIYQTLAANGCYHSRQKIENQYFLVQIAIQYSNIPK